MLIKCPACGAEGESGKECIYCKTIIPNIEEASKTLENTTSIEKIIWLNICPACKSAEVYENVKKGLISKIKKPIATCDNCGAEFKRTDDRYEVFKIGNAGHDVFMLYREKALTEREWNTIAQGGLSDEEQMKADFAIWMQGLVNGQFTLRLNEPCPIFLQQKEQFQFSLSGITLYERRTRTERHYVKAAKFGRKTLSEGKYVSETKVILKFMDQGILCLTNKRLIFLGIQGENRKIRLNKILALEPFKDGFMIVREGKKKPEFFTGIEMDRIFTINVGGRQHQIYLTKEIMIEAIRSLI
ncbi:MAG: hypothetical protein ACTSQE_14445 [Candidatus Heimdallarchaeaceae archaeon]